MPNQRKKGKKFVGAWLPEKLYADLQRIAKIRGVAASAIVDDLLTAHVGGSVAALKDAPNSDPALAAAEASAIHAAQQEAGQMLVSYKKPRRKKSSK